MINLEATMTIFLIIIGSLGFLIWLFNMYGGAQYIAVQLRLGIKAYVHPRTFWQLNTQPFLAVIYIFAMKHWIFIIPIFLTIIQMLLTFRQGDEDAEEMKITFPYLIIFTILGRFILTIAPAVVLTLFILNQTVAETSFLAVPWIWLWCFPLLSIAFWLISIVASWVTGWLEGVLAHVLFR